MSEADAKVNIALTLKGEAAMRLMMYSDTAEIDLNVICRELIIEGMKAKGMLPYNYVTPKRRKNSRGVGILP